MQPLSFPLGLKVAPYLSKSLGQVAGGSLGRYPRHALDNLVVKCFDCNLFGVFVNIEPKERNKKSP